MKHFQQRERALELLSKEVGYVRKPHGGKLRVALAFPNTYFVGMSNLGLQTVYKLFNAEDDIVCERVFLPPKTELAEQLAGRILRMCIEMGGSITGEHGVGVEKRDYMPEMFTADELDCMKRLRAAFDPLEIANPGKMFPQAGAPALTQHGLHPLEKAGVISRE